MNSKSNKKSDPNVLMLNFTDKTDLKKRDTYAALSNLRISIHGKT